MRYQGGKSRIAGQIAAKIRELYPIVTGIWVPFCGGGAVTRALAEAGFQVQATDNQGTAKIIEREERLYYKPAIDISRQS